jgi:hypothetical protein
MIGGEPYTLGLFDTAGRINPFLFVMNHVIFLWKNRSRRL